MIPRILLALARALSLFGIVWGAIIVLTAMALGYAFAPDLSDDSLARAAIGMILLALVALLALAATPLVAGTKPASIPARFSPTSLRRKAGGISDSPAGRPLSRPPLHIVRFAHGPNSGEARCENPCRKSRTSFGERR